MKKYYIIYKTTNILNGHYYLGKHETDDINDGYLGSGRLIRKAIKKHGEENFKREIISWAQSRDELNRLEAQFITEEVIKDPMCYNLTPGGSGGFWHINRPENIQEIVKKRKETQSKWSEERRKDVNYRKGANWRGEKNYWYGRPRRGKDSPSYGKQHSEETKRKISEANKGKPGPRLGAKNSEYSRQCARERNSSLWLIKFPDGHFEIIKNLTNFMKENNLPMTIPQHFAGRNIELHKSGFDGCKIIDGDVPEFTDDWLQSHKMLLRKPNK